MYRIYGEKCYGQTRPSALTERPDFSWRLSSGDEGITQESFEIIVYDSVFHVFWNSGRIYSEAQHNLPYEGKPLDSASDYYWIVRSYASNGETAESSLMRFSTGLLEESLWKASWIEADIEPCPEDDCLDIGMIMSGRVPERERPEETMNAAQYFRKEVMLSGPVRKVKLFATAHGIYRLFLNEDTYGEPLAPGYTVYQDYLEYQCYDVTESLHEGCNVIGAVVADGWYRGKMGLLGIGNQYGKTTALLLQLMITYEDGTQEIIGSDASFTAGTGAFVYADIFVGEGYDASKEPRGWMKPGFCEPSWKPVLVKEYGYTHLRGSVDEPAGFLRVQRPARVFTTPKGELIADAGENVAGFLSVRGRTKKGTRVTLEYAEVLDRDGNYLKNIIGQNKNQTDVYIADRDGEFFYSPSFTFHGFQYVRITGAGELKPEDIRIFVLGSKLERTGRFICDNDKLNRLMSNIFRSQQGNMLYIPTDCPQREKSGFTGDMQVYAPAASILMDVEAFLRKWLVNCRYAQFPDGQVPNTVPDIPSTYALSGGARSSAAWGDACVIVPYRMYQAYGDLRILKDNYSMMKKWMDYVEKQAAEGIPESSGKLNDEQKEHQKYLWNTGFHFGDWLIPSLSRNGVADPFKGAEMTKELVSPAVFAYTTSLMTEIASLLKDESACTHYRFLNEKIREAYAAEYIVGKGRLKLDYQGMYVLALQMNLIPEDQKEDMTRRLVELIEEAGGCLDTGFVSMPFLLDTLYDQGRHEQAFALLFQEKCPSWLYEVNQGANTIWESWTNIAEDGTRNNSSYNHFSFGCVADFIYRRILGIQALEPGYKKVRICPDLSCGLHWVKGSQETIHGRIEAEWEKQDRYISLSVTIPPNVTAEIDFAGRHYTTGSGQYHFK